MNKAFRIRTLLAASIAVLLLTPMTSSAIDVEVLFDFHLNSNDPNDGFGSMSGFFQLSTDPNGNPEGINFTAPMPKPDFFFQKDTLTEFGNGEVFDTTGVVDPNGTQVNAVGFSNQIFANNPLGGSPNGFYMGWGLGGPNGGDSRTVVLEGSFDGTDYTLPVELTYASGDFQWYLGTHFDNLTGDPNTGLGGFDVVTDNKFYQDREGVEWEELAFSMNGTRWGSDRPAFPLLQPEKVLSLPLNLQLNREYEYELEGYDRLGDRDCYVVRFEPLSDERSLYRGKVWIDSRNFVKLKIQAVQTNLSSPVVSNEEIHYYTLVEAPDGVSLYLLSKFDSRQIFLIAGRNLLVERQSRFSDFSINSPEFEAGRQAARSSEHIMLRDTEQGLRYLVKRGGDRVVSEKLTKTATALAMGTTIDPSYEFPLPILGISHLDFNFLNRDMQFSLLFGGVLAIGNIQAPSFLGTPLDMSIDFIGIALRGNDNLFDEGGEVIEERLLTRPLSTGLNIGWQFTDFQKLLGGLQLEYSEYKRADTTAEEFVTPSSTLTYGLSFGYEYKRGGYSLVTSASTASRASWKPWGDTASFDPETCRYQKYSVTLAKDFFFSAFQKVHFDVGYFGGTRLDRFTKYQSGMFDATRIHGVPSSAIRFDDLVLLRGAYSFNVFDQYRFDLFYDHGFGRDPSRGLDHVRLSGLGLALNLRGPRHTLIRAEVGKSFLPDVYHGSGTVVAQILVLKPL